MTMPTHHDTPMPISLTDKLVNRGDISVSTGAKIAGLPYADYLRNLSANGYSVLDDAPGALDGELAVLGTLTTP